VEQSGELVEMEKRYATSTQSLDLTEIPKLGLIKSSVFYVLDLSYDIIALMVCLYNCQPQVALSAPYMV
jgi:hypothetical protein